MRILEISLISGHKIRVGILGDDIDVSFNSNNHCQVVTIEERLEDEYDPIDILVKKNL